MKVLKLQQGSPDWLLWREKGIGSSDACHLMEVAPWNSIETLRGIKTGKVRVNVNEAMKRGTELEPVARVLVNQMTGLNFSPQCAIHEQYPWMKASLDGLSEDGKIILEIKCPTKHHVHLKAMNGAPPDYYMPQIQHQLMVSGVCLCLFASYRPEEEDVWNRLIIVPVKPDIEYQDKLLDLELKFKEEMGW